MKCHKFKQLAAIITSFVLTSAMLCSCGDKDAEGAADSSSSTQTAAPSVTLPSSDSSSIEDESTLDSEEEADSETQDDYAPAMWLVTDDDGNSMYMMGSMHALKEECYPLPDYVTDAYEQADVLAVECDITDLTATMSATLKYTDKITYSSGETLGDHISEETCDGIESYLEAHGESYSAYEIYQPWYVSSLLENLAIEDAALSSDLGLDMQLLTMAHDDEKEIYEVESAEFQMDLLVNLSDDIYDIVLSSYSEENVELITDEYNDMYTAWRTGDTDTMLELNTVDDSELDDEQKVLVDEYNNALLNDRNIGMTETAEELLSSGDNVLFVVGEAHFLGDGGIIDLLEQDGYTVERVTDGN
ncbi:MAG: TraB/GumN family protein [Ruminococcus sp.]|nr:TraB/GumN family protein [Ruminococcus sp.]